MFLDFELNINNIHYYISYIVEHYIRIIKYSTESLLLLIYLF